MRGLPSDFHLLPQLVAEFHFARRMKFISHRWVLLHENEIAVKPAHTTLYCCLSLGRFRVVRTRATVILRLSAVRLNPSPVEMRTLCQPPDAASSVISPPLTTQLTHVTENKPLSSRS